MTAEIIVAIIFCVIGMATWRFNLIEFVGFYNQADRSHNKPARVTKLIGFFLLVNSFIFLLLGYLRLKGLSFLYAFFFPVAVIAAFFLRAKVKDIQNSEGAYND